MTNSPIKLGSITQPTKGGTHQKLTLAPHKHSSNQISSHFPPMLLYAAIIDHTAPNVLHCQSAEVHNLIYAT